MLFINSLKILFNNVSLIFKVLLYKLLALLISCSVVFSFAYPSFSKMYQAGAFNSFREITKSNGFKNVISNISEALNNFWNVLQSMDKKITVVFIVSVVILIVLSSFLLNLDKIAQTEIISAKLNSNCKLSYSGILFKRLGYSCVYSMFKTFYTLIFDAVVFIVAVFSFKLLDISGFWGIIAPLIIFIIVVLMVAFSYTVFGGHSTSCVVNQTNCFKGFANSIKIAFKKFFKNYAYYFVLIAAITLINYAFGSILSGVFLVVSAPLSLVYITIFQSVMFFNNNGNRYYLDAKTIVSPHKNEFYDKVKNIIDII